MRGKKLSRRDFLRVSALTAAGAALVGCAPTTPAPEEPAEPEEEKPPEPVEEAPPEEGVVVQYWFSWGSTYAGQTWDALRETDEFAEAIGNNTLETKGSAGDAITTAVAAGTPPDGGSNIAYLDYMARDVLISVEDYVAASPLIKEEKYLELNWRDGFYKGTMYGVPANESFLRYGLNYNRKLVEAAGLDPNDPPHTWSEVFEWHKALTIFDEADNLLQIGLDPYDAMGGALNIQDGFWEPFSWGFDWYNEDTGEFNLDNEMLAEAFETEAEFYRYVGPDNMAGMRQVEGQGTWGGSFNAEVQAMIIEGYWHPGETIIEMPEVGQYNMCTWAPVPDHRKGVKVQGQGGHYVIIFKESKHPDEMFKIAEFLNTNTACEIIFANVGWLPAIVTFLDTVDPDTYPGLKFYFDSIDTADEWYSPARCPITQYCQQQCTELREAVYRDQMTGAEAAAEFQKRADAEYKQAGFG